MPKAVRISGFLDSGQLKQVAVKLGIGDDNFTEILEGDAKEGQEAVIAETISKSTPKDVTKKSRGAKPVLN